VPRDVEFSKGSDRIYAVTNVGVFYVWLLDTLECKCTIDFGLESVRMASMKRNSFVFIAFKREVVGVDVTNTIAEPVATMSIKSLLDVTDLKVAPSEQILAVSFHSNSETMARIQLYRIHYDTKSFSSLAFIDNIQTEVQLMDFAEDNSYLLYKDKITLPAYFDLRTMKKTDLLPSNLDLEWMSDGIKLSSTTAGLSQWCEEGNTFNSLVRYGNRSLIVTDDIGAVPSVYLDPHLRVPLQGHRILQALHPPHELRPYLQALQERPLPPHLQSP
jgi:hypothetical protein